MTALKQQCSFPAEKRYRQKKPPPYISNTCSSATGYPPRSSAIETLDLRPSSHVNCAKPWASRRTFPRLITRERMDNQCHVSFCGLPLPCYVGRRGHLLSRYD